MILAGVAAFCSSVLSGVAGFGGALIFLPFLVALYGARSSVPILSVAVLLGNASRVYFNRKELNLRVVLLFSLGAIPLAILGSMVYVALPGLLIKKAIGLFLVLSALYQRFRKPFRFGGSWVFAPVGAASGFLSAIVGGIGPFTAPFFLAYGLAKEAFVGTESLCAVVMHLTKSITYGKLNILGRKELAVGLVFGAIMSVGSYAAKKILERLSREKFLLVVEILLVLIGIYMFFT